MPVRLRPEKQILEDIVKYKSIVQDLGDAGATSPANKYVNPKVKSGNVQREEVQGSQQQV